MCVLYEICLGLLLNQGIMIIWQDWGFMFPFLPMMTQWNWLWLQNSSFTFSLLNDNSIRTSLRLIRTGCYKENGGENTANNQAHIAHKVGYNHIIYVLLSIKAIRDSDQMLFKIKEVVYSYYFLFFIHSNARLYLAVFSAVLGNFNFGYALVYPSPVIPQLKNSDNPQLRMDTEQIAWFGVSETEREKQ